MTATNKPMTGAQLDELMAVAMRMQYDSEKMGERSVSMFAYAVQVAVLEIRETRCKYEELQSQNADLAVHLANAESKCRELAAENAALKQSKPSLKTMMSALDAFYAAEDVPESAMLIAFNILRGDIETPDTDAFLAEVRASSIPDEATERDLFEEWVMEKIFISKTTLEGLRTNDGYRNSTLSGADYNGMWSQWKAIRAAQLRKGAAL